MKKQLNNMISYVLPIFLLTVLFIFLILQILGVKNMYHQELWRLRTELQQNTIDTSVMLEEEIVLLPTLIKTKMIDRDKIIDKVSKDIEFWKANAVSENLYSSICLLDLDNPDFFFEWNDSGFVEISFDNTENLGIPDITTLMVLVNEFHGKYNISYITTPASIDYLLAPVFITDSNLFILCRINTSVLANEVIPNFINKCFYDNNNYYMRITDNVTNTVIFQTNNDIDNLLFEKPDFSWSVFSSQPKSDQYISYTLIQSKRDFSIENFSEDGVQQAFSVFRSKPSRTDEIQQELELPFSIQNNDEKSKSSLLMEVIHKDGSVLRAALQSTIVNALSSIIIFLILLSGIIILQRTLQKAQRLAEKQQNFISTITHELKTPIAVISSASQNMSDGIIRSTEKIVQYGNMIKKESDRLKTTIDFFLLYGNLNSTSKLNNTFIDFNNLVKEIYERYETSLKTHGYTCDVEIPNKSIIIAGDQTALTCVIQNLIDNVIKHASSGQYLGIFITEETVRNPKKTKKSNAIQEEYVVLRVCDKGKGVPKKEQPHIFDPFFRGEQAQTNQIEGSGIGLNLVKRIIIINKGMIELESSSSKGSQFVIRLPIYNSNGGIEI